MVELHRLVAWLVAARGWQSVWIYGVEDVEGGRCHGGGQSDDWGLQRSGWREAGLLPWCNWRCHRWSDCHRLGDGLHILWRRLNCDWTNCDRGGGDQRLYGGGGHGRPHHPVVAHHMGPVGRVHNCLEQTLELVGQVLVACLLVCLHLDLVTGRQKGIEPNDQLRMAFEQHRHSGNNSGSVN